MAHFDLQQDQGEDLEYRVWEAFQQDGEVSILHENGSTENLVGLEIARSESENDFYTAYSNAENLWCEVLNIPDAVLTQISSEKFPEAEFEWNAAECYHVVEQPEEPSEEFWRDLFALFRAKGFKEIDL